MSDLPPPHTDVLPDASVAPQRPRTLSRPVSQHIVLIACTLLVWAIYAWLLLVGRASSSATLTDYYDQLATAFGQGHLFLAAKPDPALLALPNPYDPEQRTGIDYPVDFSLYRGQYFLYFGPAPALLLLAAKAAYAGTIGDEYLVLLFSCGAFLLSALLLLRIWERSFARAPAILLVTGLLMAGLAMPSVYAVGKANVYTAAISAGQFFLIGGLYCVVADMVALDRIRPSRLWLTGLLWGLAIASRVTLLLPAGFMTLMVMVTNWRGHQGARGLARALSAYGGMALMLALVGAALAWYNWARFGSVFETGLTYELAGSDLRGHPGEWTSPAYLVQNLYNYGVNLPARTAGFPFLYATRGQRDSIVGSIKLPAFYRVRRLTGVLVVCPWVLLAVLPALRSRFRGKAKEMLTADERPLWWTGTSLLGCSVIAAIPILTWFWSAERFVLEFLPCAALASAIGVWLLASWLEPGSMRRTVYVGVAAGGVALTLVAGILVTLGTIPLGY